MNKTSYLNRFAPLCLVILLFLIAEQSAAMSLDSVSRQRIKNVAGKKTWAATVRCKGYRQRISIIRKINDENWCELDNRTNCQEDSTRLAQEICAAIGARPDVALDNKLHTNSNTKPNTNQKPRPAATSSQPASDVTTTALKPSLVTIKTASINKRQALVSEKIEIEKEQLEIQEKRLALRKRDLQLQRRQLELEQELGQ